MEGNVVFENLSQKIRLRRVQVSISFVIVRVLIGFVTVRARSVSQKFGFRSLS